MSSDVLFNAIQKTVNSFLRTGKMEEGDIKAIAVAANNATELHGVRGPNELEAMLQKAERALEIGLDLKKLYDKARTKTLGD